MRINLIILFILGSCLFLQGQTLQQDSLILVEIYNATDGNNWNNDQGWLDGPLSSWNGVKVNNNRVTELDLRVFGLKANIPDALYNLSALEVFRMRETSDFVVVNDKVRQLTKLEKFEMEGVRVDTDFSIFCELENLNFLGIRRTNITQDLPDCLKDTGISQLNLSDSSLPNNAIPAIVADMQNLTFLALKGSGIEGPIPPFLCELNFTILNLSENKFTGQIPTCLNQNNSMSSLILFSNQLEGDVPNELLRTDIRTLNLGENNLSGTLDNWPQTTELTTLNIVNNNYSGTVNFDIFSGDIACLLYTSPSPRDQRGSRMPSSA